MFAGELLLTPFGGIQAMPDAIKDAHQSVQENKLVYGGFIFLGGMVLSPLLLQSGAFEIYINGNLEFSKLACGHMPSLKEIHGILAKYDVYV